MISLPSPRCRDATSFGRSAAKLAVITPGLVIALALASGLAANCNIISRFFGMLVGLLAILLVVAGVVCALIALRNAMRYGPEGLLVRGLIGLVLNGALLGIFTVSMARGFARGRAEAVQARESQRHSRAATDATKIATVAAAYLEQMNVAARNFDGANSVMQVGKVLQFPKTPDAEDFARRRRLVQNYQLASERIRALLTNAPAFYRTELERLGVAPAEIDKAAADVQERSAVQNQLICEVRNTDDRLTSATLKILDLLERNPDQWKWKSRRVVFSNAQTGGTYDRLLQEIQNAATAQIEAQRKLAGSE